MHILGGRVTDLPLDGRHQGSRLAAHEGPAAPSDLEIEGQLRTQNVPAQKTVFPGLGNRGPCVLDGQGVFLANVDVTSLSADRPGADQHALDHKMRVSLEDAPVHVGPGISFVGVTDDVLQVAGRGPAGCPLAARRVSCTASSPEAGGLEFFDDTLGLHAGQHLCQCLVASRGDVVFDGAGIDLPVLAEKDAFLRTKEGNIRLGAHPFPRHGILVKEPLDRLAPRHTRNEFRCIFRGHAAVECVARLDHDDRPLFAEALAARDPNSDLFSQALFGELLFQGLHNGRGPGCLTPGAVADRQCVCHFSGADGKLAPEIR